MLTIVVSALSGGDQLLSVLNAYGANWIWHFALGAILAAVTWYLTIRGSKASTSRRMAVWVPDFLSRYDPDPLRYYLAAHGPVRRWSPTVPGTAGEWSAAGPDQSLSPVPPPRQPAAGDDEQGVMTQSPAPTFNALSSISDIRSRLF